MSHMVPKPILNAEKVLRMSEYIAKNVLVDEKITDYISRIMNRIRENENGYLLGGVSLRVSL